MTGENRLETFYGIIDWVLSHLEATLAILVFLVVIKLTTDYANHISKIRDKYKSRTKSNVKFVLSGIVDLLYTRIVNNEDILQVDCPNGNDNCRIAGGSLDQQLAFYHLLLRDIFFVKEYNNVMHYINNNGYHDLTETEYLQYVTDKGTTIYNSVISSIKVYAFAIPSIIDTIGSNYTVEESIISFKKIIDNAIKNDIKEETEINKFIKLFFKFIFKRGEDKK